ncbi:hypothetical protein J132_05651 [Termitomyces sp. J132]|nr:hypothetical protein H2248_005207 [Termitomyces sp. 'cryptogamus']KNZ80530.1 hypothetical protein J132_05651 [Termitomyces sp. J132]
MQSSATNFSLLYGSNLPSIELTPVQHLNGAHEPASLANILHEASMREELEPEPLSAYARWKIEEDERFYATFPEARCAAQQYNTLSSAYLVGTGYHYNEEGRIARSNELTCYDGPSAYAYTVYDDEAASLEPQRIDNDHCYDSDCRTSDLSRALTQNSATRNYNQPQSSAETIQTNIVVSSQQPLSIPESPPMDFLPSPDSPAQPAPNTNLIPAPTMFPKTEYSHPSLAYADPSLYHLSAYSRSYNFYPTTSQDGWPVCTPLPRSVRLSPLPPSRRPIAKKPPLACLFCRGRKIACGPPDPGSPNRSCK